MLAGGALVAAAVLRAGSGPLHGGLSLLAFGALVVVTALSITWSIAPELSYVEAGRVLAYLAVFAGAVALARLAPRSAPMVPRGCCWAHWPWWPTRWPRASGPGHWPRTSSRTGSAALGYWNAVGTTAALAVPAAIWLGARRAGNVTGRALAYPALGLCLVAILLTPVAGSPGGGARRRHSVAGDRAAAAAQPAGHPRAGARCGAGVGVGLVEGCLLEEPSAARGQGERGGRVWPASCC